MTSTCMGGPLSHVQADAGHDSIDTTSKYLHTSNSERHESAQQKPLDRLNQYVRDNIHKD